MAERDFDEEYGLDQLEGHTFVLGGQKFHTLPVSTPEAWLALRTEQGLGGVIAYLRKMLIPEDVEAFDEMLADENRAVLVSAVQIDAVASWLFEMGTGRPTKAPKSSGTGRGKNSE